MQNRNNYDELYICDENVILNIIIIYIVMQHIFCKSANIKNTLY